MNTTVPWGNWSHYHSYEEIKSALLYLNSTYPNLVDVFSVGKSYLGRNIYCIRLTNENYSYCKPEILYVGYHHARERISAEMTLYLAIYAVENFQSNATIARALDLTEIYIVVALNVDGLDSIESNEWQRKNSRPFDEDNDGLLDEDPPDDEDGDGYIEQLGSFEWGTFETIRWEGKDDDNDGMLNEDWVGGVDLNRNFGYQWNATVDSGSQDKSAEDYRGPEPFSEPETQAMRDLVLRHSFRYAVSYHSGTESIGYPWTYTPASCRYNQNLREVAASLSALVGAPFGPGGAWYTCSGEWGDWMYSSMGAMAFTCEIFGNQSAWQYEPGPQQGTYWQKGIFQLFNPPPHHINRTIQKWLPTFMNIVERTLNELAGDLNFDGKMDLKDLAIAAKAFGSDPGHPRYLAITDMNNDSQVDIEDILRIARNFGKNDALNDFS